MGDKRFRNALNGFNKNDVYKYIENILNEKDNEIENLVIKGMNTANELNLVKEEYLTLLNDKEEISQSLIRATREAGIIVLDAHKKVEQEKIEANQYLSQINFQAEEVKNETNNKLVVLNNEIQRAQEELDRLKDECKKGVQKLQYIYNTISKAKEFIKESLK